MIEKRIGTDKHSGKDPRKGGKNSGSSITNNDQEISSAEIQKRLIELIFNMPEAEQLDLLIKLEKRTQSKQEEKRKHLRERVLILMDCLGNNCAFTDFIQNISAGGLFIETQLPLFVGLKLSMTFSLPKAQDPIRITGEIVRVDSKGIGIQFDKLLPVI
jgi:Tfp pilus assembly protein PilZ